MILPLFFVYLAITLAQQQPPIPQPGPQQPPIPQPIGQQQPVPQQQPQRQSPLKNFTSVINAFHFESGNFCHQVEATHYCQRVNSDFTQCILFDRTGQRLVGVEYIVSEKILKTLPREEKALWHSHKFEFTSGLAVSPGLSVDDQVKFAQQYANTYGKTFHTFDEAATLPIGIPALMMAFTKQGQLDNQLIQKRDQALGINSDQLRTALQTAFPKQQDQQGQTVPQGQIGQQQPGQGQIGHQQKIEVDRDVDSWKRGYNLQLDVQDLDVRDVEKWKDCEVMQQGGLGGQEQGQGQGQMGQGQDFGQDFGQPGPWGQGNMYGGYGPEASRTAGQQQGQTGQQGQQGQQGLARQQPRQ